MAFTEIMLSSRDKETFAQILIEKGPFEINDDDEDEDQEACRNLVEELSLEEQETAAKASYAYWLSTVREDIGALSSSSTLSDRSELRMRYAMREARRHYVGKGRKYDRALSVLQNAIALRDWYKIDLIRWIPEMDENIDQNMNLSVEEKQIIKRYKRMVQEELEKQITVSSGSDRDGHAVLIRFPRMTPDIDMESFMIANLYTAERGIAATEYQTRGKGETLVLISEFANYSSGNAPPLWTLRETTDKFQRLYPGRLRKLVMTDPPFFIRALYTLLYPFLGKATKEKIVMAFGAKDKEAKFLELLLFDGTHALPLMQEDLIISSNPVNINDYMAQQMFESYVPRDPSPQDESKVA